MTDLFSKIKEVTELPAISGHEAPVRDYLRKQITHMWMKWSQTAWEVFLGYATQKWLMLLASWSQAIWMKLALWSVRSRQTAPSAWWKSVVGTLWWSAANVSPF